MALMDLENIRILKEMRNSVNRKVNCETANINKTVNAAVKQMEDIKLVRQKIGFEQLNEGLAQVAELRMQPAGGQIGSQSQTEKAECNG